MSTRTCLDCQGPISAGATRCSACHVAQFQAAAAEGRAERMAQARELLSYGLSPQAVADDLGLRPEALARAAYRAGDYALGRLMYKAFRDRAAAA